MYYIRRDNPRLFRIAINSGNYCKFILIPPCFIYFHTLTVLIPYFVQQFFIVCLVVNIYSKWTEKVINLSVWRFFNWLFISLWSKGAGFVKYIEQVFSFMKYPLKYIFLHIGKKKLFSIMVYTLSSSSLLST